MNREDIQFSKENQIRNNRGLSFADAMKDSRMKSLGEGKGISFSFIEKERVIFMTPLREKTFELKDLWSISKLIKCFINIKSAFKAYKNNYYTLKKQELKNKLKEEEDKELSFDPEINRLKYHFRNAKFEDYNSKNDDLNKTFSTSKKNDFNKIYKRFIDEKNSREKALEIMREIKKEKELKKCTSKPSIIEYKPRKTYLANRMNKSVDFSISDTNYNQKKYRYLKNYIA